MADRDSLGERLLLSRRRAKLTQQELHIKAGVGLNTITRLEQGRSQQVSTAVLLRLAETLGVSTDYLLGRTPDRRAEPADEEEHPEVLATPHA